MKNLHLTHLANPTILNVYTTEYGTHRTGRVHSLTRGTESRAGENRHRCGYGMDLGAKDERSPSLGDELVVLYRNVPRYRGQDIQRISC